MMLGFSGYLVFGKCFHGIDALYVVDLGIPRLDYWSLLLQDHEDNPTLCRLLWSDAILWKYGE
jgi:hypothetical protein